MHNTVYIHTYVHASGEASKSWPRQVELTHKHSKKRDYHESLYVTTVITPSETSLIALVFIIPY